MREQSNITRRRLFDQENTIASQQIEVWSEEEIKALVEFVLFHSEKNAWPCHKRESFWNGAATYVMVRSRKSYQRTGNACRYKVVGWLKAQYYRPSDAEKHFLRKPDNELELLSKSYSDYCAKNLDIEIPDDFVQLSATAMALLKKNRRSNVLYNLAKGLACFRPDQSDTRFPMNRMPMGLLEYMTNFFVAEEMRKIPHCPDDYLDWQETMYVQFGSKWSKLHHGPMWLSEDGVDMNSMKARVNIPAVSERTLRRGISAACVTVTSAIQTSVLDEAATTHPNAWWWLKADGCDLNCGLNESVRLEWNGDVDVNDGKLQSMYTDYLNHLSLIDEMGSTTRPHTSKMCDI